LIQATLGNVAIATGRYTDTAATSLVTAGQRLTLAATGAVASQGLMEAGADTGITAPTTASELDLTAGSLTGSGTIETIQGSLLIGTGGDLTNAGTVLAADAAGLMVGGALSNSGTIGSQTQGLTVAAGSLANTGTLIGATTTGLAVTGALTNSGAGALIASEDGALTIEAGTLREHRDQLEPAAALPTGSQRSAT
jgi:filamentous hemagglutinin